MNEFDQERIGMITVMLMYITRLDEDVISKYVMKTRVYENILDGEETTLYDGYSANLMEMVNEWEQLQNIPIKLKMISAQDVTRCNVWLEKNKFQCARQAKDMLRLKRRRIYASGIKSMPYEVNSQTKPKRTKRVITRVERKEKKSG